MLRLIYPLLLLFLIAHMACAGEPTPTPRLTDRWFPPTLTPIPPTPISRSTIRPTNPYPRPNPSYVPQQPPTPTSVFYGRALSVDEYPAACGSMMGYEIAAPGDKVELWGSITPPVEYRDFHNAEMVHYQYLLSPDGSNEDSLPTSHAAFELKNEAVGAMTTELQNALVATGCISRSEISDITRTLEAKARMAERDVREEPLSIDEYAQQCRDILLTVPYFDTRQAVETYLLTEWGKVTPPPEVSGFHAAVIAWWKERLRTGVIDFESPQALAMYDEGNRMDAEAFDRLALAGCIVS